MGFNATFRRFGRRRATGLKVAFKMDIFESEGYFRKGNRAYSYKCSRKAVSKLVLNKIKYDKNMTDDFIISTWLRPSESTVSPTLALYCAHPPIWDLDDRRWL